MNRNKKLLTKTIVAGLCAAVTMNTAMTALAADTSTVKDENIYGTLNQDGTVSGIYVVNEFSSESKGQVSDYGDYVSVKNLTNDSELQVKDGQVTAELPEGKFYYQGDLESKELPWDISIAYFLDGKEIGADELAGKSGDLKIVIQTKKNPAVNEAFFNHYLLQATAVLNTEKCTEIQAEGATEGNVGVNRQLVYSIMPGQEKEIVITAKVEEFEMDAITFQGVPMSLAIDSDTLDIDALTDQTKELTDAVAMLDDGAGELKKGTEAAAEGGTLLADGISALADGTNALKAGGSTLASGTSSLLAGTKGLQDGVTQYASGVENYTTGVEQYVAGVDMLAQGARLLAPLEKLGKVNEGIVQLYGAFAVGDEENEVPSLQSGAQELSDGLHAISEQVKLLEHSTDAEELQQLLVVLNQISDGALQIAETAEDVSKVIDNSAGIIADVRKNHQAVLENLNTQVDGANQVIDGVNQQIAGMNSQVNSVNQQITESVDKTNAQIDTAINSVQKALNEAVQNGTIDQGTADQTLESLKSSVVKVEGTQVAPLTTIEQVAVIQMPEEDAALQEQIGQLENISAELKTTASGMNAAVTQLGQAASGLAGALPTVGESADGNPITVLSQALSAICDGADSLADGVEQVGTALAQLGEGTSEFEQAAEGIKALNGGFEELTKNNSLLIDGGHTLNAAKNDLLAGTRALYAGTFELNAGVGQYTSGVNALNDGALLLNANTGTLTDGLAALDEGTGKLKDGTSQFREQTDGMDEQIEEQISEVLDEMSGSEFVPVSFTSDQNENIGLVQFAITTDGIKLPEAEEEVQQEEEEGFLDRLKKLFQ